MVEPNLVSLCKDLMIDPVEGGLSLEQYFTKVIHDLKVDLPRRVRQVGSILTHILCIVTE